MSGGSLIGTRADLRAILRSGYVRRWHANPDMLGRADTVGQHHAQVAQIIIALHPAPSLALIAEALHHDCGEMLVGDLPGPFKALRPGLALQHADLEQQGRDRMGASWEITESDEAWLRLADRLSAYFHVAHVAPHLLAGDGWPEARAELTKLAGACGARALAAIGRVLNER